jgi:pullulanase
MKRNDQGYWSIKLSLPSKVYDDHSYYFLIIKPGEAKKIVDPLAQRISVVDGEYRSYFENLNYLRHYRFFLAPAIDSIVIYETHLPALSRHKSAVLSEEKYRGTYLGARSDFVLDHLQKLNVAVEFLPLHSSDKTMGQDWGYYSVCFRALRNDYAVDEKNINHELMQLIGSLHSRGIPVILDVVFNHGAELWVKAWGTEVVYRSLDEGQYCQGSGCGASVKTENQHIRKTIVDTLLYLVKQFHIDGFRFDLAALHDKETMIEIDKQLPKRVYLIGEPWALSGAHWGKQEMSSDFAHTRWAIWNDDFRESGRVFINGHGDYHNRDILMRGIAGSHINDGGWALRPQQSLNYLSCHDGQTLADLVGGNKQRAFLGVFLVLTSQGIPMLGEGSEMLYTKQGHHNSYDRPDLNQLDWDYAGRNCDLVEAVGRLVEIRKSWSHFHYTGHLKVNDHKNDNWNIDWIYPTGYPHNDNVNAIGYLLRPPREYLFWYRKHRPLLILLNGSHSGVNFQLPKGKWKVMVDGLYIKVDANGISMTPAAKGHYHLHPGTCAMLTPS